MQKSMLKYLSFTSLALVFSVQAMEQQDGTIPDTSLSAMKVTQERKPLSQLTCIEIVKSNNEKIAWKIDAGHSLSSLRATLQAREVILEGDVFQKDGGAIILREEEESWFIQDILKDGRLLSLHPKNPIFGFGATPQKPDTSRFLPSQRFEINHSPIDVGAGLTPETSSSSTANMAYYSSLSTGDRDILFNSLNLKRALNIFIADSSDLSDSQSQEVKIQPSFKTSIVWDQEPEWLYPENVLTVDRSFSFSKTHHELRKLGMENVKASAGYLGISMSAEYAQKQESLNNMQETHAYVLATYNVPKVELSIPEESIKASPEFEGAIKKIIGQSGASKSHTIYANLLKILKDYGFFVPTKFVLGGQIYAEDRKKINSLINAESETDSFALALEANLSFYGVPASMGGGYGKTKSSSQTDSESRMGQKIFKQVRGGDPAKANDPAQWMTSLGPYMGWAVIKRDQFVPIIKFLEPNLRSACTKLINQHCLSFNKVHSDGSLIDMQTYVRELLVSGDALDDL